MKLLMKIIYINHLVACLWHYTYRMSGFSNDSWVHIYFYQDTPNFNRYIASLYWSIQTLTTVGYGDIAPNSQLEMSIAIIWMFFGVGFLTYTMGCLNSIVGGLSR